MEPVNARPDVLEVLDRGERVERWYVLGERSLRIGRDYNNDVVVHDPLVCAHHAELTRADDGTVWLQDLGSLNGSFVDAGRTPVSRVALSDQALLRIGETQLRYRSARIEPTPTRIDRTAVSPLRHLRNPWVIAACVLVFPPSLLVESWLASTEALELRRVLGDLVGPLFAVLIWAGLWAFASRLLVHRMRFGGHLAIACLAMTVGFWVDGLLRGGSFALALDRWLVWMDPLASLVVLGLALYAHLRLASVLGRRRIAFTALTMAALVVLATSYRSWLPSHDFSPQPRFHATLKPPTWQWVQPESADAFYERMRELGEPSEE